MLSTMLRPATCALALGLGVALTGSAATAADDDIVFKATLSADDEATATTSPGSGTAEVRLERATLRITWKVTYQGLGAPPIHAALYGPENAGATAGEVVDLAPKGSRALASPIEGSTVLSDGVFSYLISGRVYVNLSTRRYPNGELRGQLRRQRKPT